MNIILTHIGWSIFSTRMVLHFITNMKISYSCTNQGLFQVKKKSDLRRVVHVHYKYGTSKQKFISYNV